MASAIRIREWRAEDFDALHALDATCFPPRIAYSRRTLRSFLRLAGIECLVAEESATLAGFILTHSAGRHGHIISLDVDADSRRRGIGSMLLAAAEERMESRGVRHIELETAVDNHAAVAFWQRHAFETVGVLKNYYAHRVDALAMTRNLGKSKEKQTACISTKPSSWPSSRA